MHEKYLELKGLLAPIQDLTLTRFLLSWDQQTMMPARGAAARAEQMATLTSVIHEKFTDPGIGHLLGCVCKLSFRGVCDEESPGSGPSTRGGFLLRRNDRLISMTLHTHPRPTASL
jgi:hypothetical protein